MPIHSDVDHAGQLVRFRIVGEWSTDEMLSAVTSALDILQPGRCYDVLSDHSEIGEPATPEQVRALIRLLAERGSAFLGRRAVMVTASPASYGMMRMLGAHCDGIGLDVHVVWSLEDGMRLLGREVS
jgi:hypothetical protein